MKTPTVFTEESERYHMRAILPIDVNATTSERSVGGNVDVNYRTQLGGLGFSINQLFFYGNKKGLPFATKRRIIVAERNRLEIRLDFKQYEFGGDQSFPFSIPKNYERN